MSNFVNPTIFFSVSSTGKEVLDFISKTTVDFDQDVNSRFVRWISIDDQCRLTSSLKGELEFPVKSASNKKDAYAAVSHQREEFISVFQGMISDMYNIENQNFASGRGIEIMKAQIVILASADDPLLSPFLFPLLQSLGSIPQKPSVHNILLSNKELNTNSSTAARCYRNAFFKELERFRLKHKQHPLFVWLIDIINAEEISLGNKQNVYNAIAKFSDVLIKNGDTIESSTITYSDELEKPCLYSTFGYSLLTFPANRIKDYIYLHAAEKELGNLSSGFTEKIERITFKEVLNNFLRGSGFVDIPDKLGKRDNSENIFVGFVFDHKRFIAIEEDAVLSKKLGIVDAPETLSAVNTNDFFHRVGEYEKQFVESVLTDVASHRQAAKTRELNSANNLILAKQKELIDEKGINYAFIFTSLLVNNESSVAAMLEGRHVQFESLDGLEDTFRSLFIGDIVDESIRKLGLESDNYTNKVQLVKKNQERVEASNESLERLEANVGKDNPKYAEIIAETEALIEEINRLKGDIEKHGIEIKSLKHEIEEVKNDFERDAYKESLKLARNEKNQEAIESVKESLEPIDQNLTRLYGEKNEAIETRKKFIFKRLMIVPAICSAILILINVLLFVKTSFYSADEFLYGFGVVTLVIAVYYGIALFGFYKLKKKFEQLLNDIKSLHTSKSSAFSEYVVLKNRIYLNDFDFEKDLIALTIAGRLIDDVKKSQIALEDFVNKINSESINYREGKSKFQFQDSSFEFCVVKKTEVERLFDIAIGSSILDTSDSFKLSDCYIDFLDTGTIDSMLEPIREQADAVCERKVDKVSLKSILFNESSDFPENVNTTAKFQQLIDTSRPLLRTVGWPGISSADVPYTQNILVGKQQPVYETYLAQINGGSSVIDANDDNVLGVLSVKSNFPSFMIFDVEENEELLRKLDKKQISEFFIDEKNLNYSLIPSLNVLGNETQDGNLLSSELIVALTVRIIEFNLEESKFQHRVVGDLGFSFEELINVWNSPVCFDVVEEVRELDEEILNYNNDEFEKYTKSFIQFWATLPLRLPNKYLVELEEYFYSVQGKLEDWNDLKKVLKGKRNV